MTLKIHEVSDFSDSQFLAQFLEKMQKLIRKLSKCFANFELRTANANPETFHKFHRKTPVLESLFIRVTGLHAWLLKNEISVGSYT